MDFVLFYLWSPAWTTAGLWMCKMPQGELRQACAGAVSAGPSALTAGVVSGGVAPVKSLDPGWKRPLPNRKAALPWRKSTSTSTQTWPSNMEWDLTFLSVLSKWGIAGGKAVMWWCVCRFPLFQPSSPCEEATSSIILWGSKMTMNWTLLSAKSLDNKLCSWLHHLFFWSPPSPSTFKSV